MLPGSQTLLALDPGTKEMGIALFDGPELADYLVKTFRMERSAHQLLTQGKKTMERLLQETQPDVVVIEKPFFAKTRRSALLTFLVQELRAHVRGGDVTLREYGPRRVRQILLDNPRATKRDIAQAVVRRYPELARHLHPGDFWREKYWSHVFDAVALGLADEVVRKRRRS